MCFLYQNHLCIFSTISLELRHMVFIFSSVPVPPFSQLPGPNTLTLSQSLYPLQPSKNKILPLLVQCLSCGVLCSIPSASTPRLLEQVASLQVFSSSNPSSRLPPCTCCYSGSWNGFTRAQERAKALLPVVPQILQNWGQTTPAPLSLLIYVIASHPHPHRGPSSFSLYKAPGTKAELSKGSLLQQFSTLAVH